MQLEFLDNRYGQPTDFPPAALFFDAVKGEFK